MPEPDPQCETRLARGGQSHPAGTKFFCPFLCRSIPEAASWTAPLLLNLGVLMAMAAMLAAIAFNNEPSLVAT